MKVVVYSTKSFEKEYLAKANHKKHDITLISNPLGIDTASFADGKDAVVVFTNDDVSAPVIKKLKNYGVKFIVTRSVGTDHIDKQAADAAGIKIANVPNYSPQSIAEHAISLIMALNRKTVTAHKNTQEFDFRLDNLQGFTLNQKTVGLLGFGKIAHCLANILNGFGCKILVYDPFIDKLPDNVNKVSLDELYKQSNIISLHTPLNCKTKHIINAQSIQKMQHGVMLINTSRGALVNTPDLLDALKKGNVGYYGADVYENEKNLFFKNHHNDLQKDELLEELIKTPNVLITPHQAFLTIEALQEIASETIKNLDFWQANKYVESSCACAISHKKEAIKKIRTQL